MIGIYCRTSKARNYKFTIEVQKDKGIEFAKKENLPYKMYVDDGISGSKDESTRIGLLELFNDIKSNKLTVIYVYDQSRIERDTPTWQLFVSLCLNYKVKYYPGGSEYNLDDPSNRMLAELLSVVNSFYTVLTSQKVREANARKVREGKTHGMKPYGYTRDEKNKYVILEEEAKHVRRIFDLSLSGIGAYTIANIFNNEGIPTKFKRNFQGIITKKDLDTNKTKEFKKENIIWRGNVISDMIRNPIYKGTRIWKMYETIPEYVDGKSRKKKRLVDQIITKDLVPPIINEELWDKVQLNLRKNKKNVGPKDYYHYLLNGLIVCGKCGHEFRGKKRPKSRDMSYKCTNKRYPDAKCDNRSINILKIESFVIRLLLLNKESRSLFNNLPNITSQIKSLNESLEAKNNELKEVSKKIAQIIRLITEMDENDLPRELSNTLSSLQQSRNRISEEIAKIDKRILSESMGTFDEKLLNAQNIVEGISKKLNITENFEIIRNLIRSLVESITVTYQKESGSYFLKIKLIGKEEVFYISHDRYKDIWSFADEHYNNQFLVKPAWMGKFLGFYNIKQKTYSYGLKISKKDYVNFD